MRTIITFDIAEDRVRYRVCKVLLARARRVQKSVFEAPELSKTAYLRLRSDCEGLIDAETDSVRYYSICASCAARIEHHGIGPGLIEVPESFEIIG